MKKEYTTKEYALLIRKSSRQVSSLCLQGKLPHRVEYKKGNKNYIIVMDEFEQENMLEVQNANKEEVNLFKENMLEEVKNTFMAIASQLYEEGKEQARSNILTDRLEVNQKELEALRSENLHAFEKMLEVEKNYIREITELKSENASLKSSVGLLEPYKAWHVQMSNEIIELKRIISLKDKELENLISTNDVLNGELDKLKFMVSKELEVNNKLISRGM